jgi:DKNYY family
MKKILSIILIVAININSFSQKTEKICHGDLCAIKCNCPYGYDLNEISKLKHIKNQFYKNENGHLYIKTSSVRPEKNGEFIEKQFFSSLISQEIDVNTFKEFENGAWHAKDKNNIYFTKPNSDGDHIWVIKNVDVRTFKCLNTIYSNYGIDKNKIYKNDDIVIGFKPNKTKFIRNKKGLIIELVQGKLKHKIE